MPPIYVSFTTTPDRIHHIQPMIQSLKNQTFLNFKPILWICNYYNRLNRPFSLDQVPSFLKNDPFVSIEFSEDYGSNTKLYPLVKKIKNPNALFITADDDTIYPKTWLEDLVQASIKDPKAAYGYRGKIFCKPKSLIQKIWPFSSPLSYKHTQTVILEPHEAPRKVDLLTGVWGICYRRHFFKSTYFDLNQCPAAAHNDDLWANGHLAKNQIDRICLPSRSLFSDLPFEKHGILRLWDSVNNGKGLNDKVLNYFREDFETSRVQP